MSARQTDIEPLRDKRSKESLRLWLRLLNCESKIEQKIRSKLRETFSITLPQFDVLAELEYTNRPLTMTELSNKLMVSNGNITGVVDRLVRDGYVERQPSAEDRRVQLINITPKGMTTFKKMAEQHEIWIDDAFNALDIKDIHKLSELLTKATKEK